MEPSNVNDNDSESDALKAMIRAHSAPLPDDGFSQRVLAALPPARSLPRMSRRKTSRWTWVAYFGGGAMGAAFAISRVGNWAQINADVTKVAGAFVPAEQAFIEPWLTLAFALCVFSLAIAWPFYRLDSGR